MFYSKIIYYLYTIFKSNSNKKYNNNNKKKL